MKYVTFDRQSPPVRNTFWVYGSEEVNHAPSYRAAFLVHYMQKDGEHTIIFKKTKNNNKGVSQRSTDVTRK